MAASERENIHFIIGIDGAEQVVAGGHHVGANGVE
jgi:hypothetical protein